MRIAYISYEHPLGITGGGIGTYVGQVARLMAALGHEVEVFSGTLQSDISLRHDGYLLHVINASQHFKFKSQVLIKFTERHKVSPFQIIESAEYGADALNVKKSFPSVPLVVKLHTPSFIISNLNSYNLTVFKKLRFLAGGILRGKWPTPYWIYKAKLDPEYELCLLANAVCSPSKSLKEKIEIKWGIKNIAIIPNPFTPPQALLSIVKTNPSALKVTYLGKLERRKGILDLMEAIPLVLKKVPDIRFLFAGNAHCSPNRNQNMEEYIKSQLHSYMKNIDFVGFVPYPKLSEIFNQTDIAVFPSLWENFPTVCLEAMSAEIAVIGTNTGGMAEILEPGKSGILIPPHSAKQIANAILHLHHNRDKLMSIGKHARNRVLTKYDSLTVGQMIVKFYTKAINAQSHD